MYVPSRLAVLQIRFRNQSVILLKTGYFICYYINCCSIENMWEISPTKMNFGEPMLKLVEKLQWPTVISSTGLGSLYMILSWLLVCEINKSCV